MAPLGPFGNRRRVVVGVSGGADSTALAWLLSRWGTPLACIVDHGLRPGSAAEAADARARLAGFGVAAEIVAARLQPGPGIAARAREARYALLFEACRRAGCADLLVAHHADDQAETVAIRRDAGSGPAGRAGMASVTYLDAARLLRPLLALPGARLRATVRAAGLAWAEDPSNSDPRSTRARVRAAMTPGGRQSLLRDAEAQGRERAAADRALAAEAAIAVSIHPAGFAELHAAVSRPLLARLVWTLSGRPYPPGSAAVARLRPGGTLHGVVVQDRLAFREAAACGPPVPAVAGARWDGRFTVGEIAEPGLVLGALGSDAAAFRTRSPLPAAVLRTVPAFRRAGELWAVPHLAFPDAAACRSVPLAFGPPRPLGGVPFARAVKD